MIPPQRTKDSAAIILIVAGRGTTLTSPGEEVIGDVIGTGPFADGLDRTPNVLWLAMALIIAGVSLASVAMVTVSLDAFVRRALFGPVIPVTPFGMILAVKNDMMGYVD